jgi:aminocarboxymuconate-semialdehyde decarboxylase
VPQRSSFCRSRLLDVSFRFLPSACRNSLLNASRSPSVYTRSLCPPDPLIVPSEPCRARSGKPLTDVSFENIWKEIDRRGLPVLVHPSAPPGLAEMGMHEFQLTAPIGFTFDTSLAIGRCIFDGFFDRFPNLKLIASHGGGALPYLVGRMDICWDNIPAARAKTDEPPRNYMRRIWVDSVVFRQDVLNMCVSVCGTDNVLYGSDYPHTIGDMAGCLSRVDALPGDVRDKVRGRNSERIFRL